MENVQNHSGNDIAKNQAKAQLENIKMMIFRIEHARECDGDMETCELGSDDILRGIDSLKEEATQDDYKEYHDQESAYEAIMDDPLSVEVRTDWFPPGDEDFVTPSEYRIVLCTGGPAVQIVGDLNIYGEPGTVRLQYQNWFVPWQDYPLSSEEKEILLTYARCFHFGD